MNTQALPPLQNTIGKRFNHLRLMGSGMLLFMLPGCLTVGPNYMAPDMPVPDAWSVGIMSDIDGRRTNLEKWWRELATLCWMT